MEPPADSTPTTSAQKLSERALVVFAGPLLCAVIVGGVLGYRSCTRPKIMESRRSFTTLKTVLADNAKIKETVSAPVTVSMRNYCMARDSASELTEYSVWITGPKGGRQVDAVVSVVGKEVHVTYAEMRGARWLWDMSKPVGLFGDEGTGRPDCGSD